MLKLPNGKTGAKGAVHKISNLQALFKEEDTKRLRQAKHQEANKDNCEE